MHALSQPDVQAQIRSKTGQVTIGKLALFRIEQLAVAVPTLKAQKAFATNLDAIYTHRAALTARLAQLDELFVSLQSRAFSGEL